MTNIDVVLQLPNKPETRHVIGRLTVGERPTTEDFARWGLEPDRILTHRPAKQRGDPIYLIVAL
jgi:hypothetical protein